LLGKKRQGDDDEQSVISISGRPPHPKTSEGSL
jgi:hypothetical protein